MESMRDAGPVTTAREVAEAILVAATDETERLRFRAGSDSERLAHARWGSSDEEFLAGMRAMFHLKEATG